MKASKLDQLESVYKKTLKEKLDGYSSDLFNFPDLIERLCEKGFFERNRDRPDLKSDVGLTSGNDVFTFSENEILRNISDNENTAVLVNEIFMKSSDAVRPFTFNAKLTTVLEWEDTEWKVIHFSIIPLDGKLHDETNKDQQKDAHLLQKELTEKENQLNLYISEVESNRIQLIKQDKLASLGALAAGIAHEIKNPLNFINNFSELSIEFIEEIYEELKGIGTNPSVENISSLLDDIKHNLNKIHQHSGRVESIVKSMLMHARGGNGKRELTDLNDLIKDYVNLAFHGMRANKNPINVDIRLQLDKNLEKVNLNPEEFSRVILNLCQNAFDAMRDKLEMEVKDYLPTITISTNKTNGEILINIADNGPGVSDEIIDKLLVPFFTTKKAKDGTGLGLSITNEIVKAHQGSLDISSKLGEGTEFKIRIPANL